MKHQSTTPQILSVNDILSKMRSGKKEAHDIKLGDYSFFVRVLTIDEVNLIRREAKSHIVKINGDQTDYDVYVQKASLIMASTLTKGGGPLLPDKVLNEMHVDEINFLYAEYVRVMESVNPSLEQITPERFRELVEALKKNIISSRDCTLLELRAICIAFQELIQRPEIPTSRKGN